MTNLTPSLGYICRSCLRSRRGSPQSTSPIASVTSHASTLIRASQSRPLQRRHQTQVAHLSHRRLIALHGPDAPNFLHGITTNTIPHSDAAAAAGHPASDLVYSAFLNAQGRVLHDVFIYPAAQASAAYRALAAAHVRTRHAPDAHAFLVEVDDVGATALLAHLKRYRLRAKVHVAALPADALAVLAVWDDAAAGSTAPVAIPAQAQLGGPDPRLPGLGARALLPPDLDPQTTTTASAYAVHRHTHGVAEGQRNGEIAAGGALPHEHNLDLLAAVDFRKGCYVGQELVIRTQHKGVVRKRVLPVALYDPSLGKPPSDAAAATDSGLFERVAAWPGADIMPRARRGRPAGRLLAGEPGAAVGLGLCRVEVMTDAAVSTEGGVRWRAGDEFVLRRRRVAARDESAEEGEGDGATTAADGPEVDEGGEVGVKAFMPDWIRNGMRVR